MTGSAELARDENVFSIGCCEGTWQRDKQTDKQTDTQTQADCMYSGDLTLDITIARSGRRTPVNIKRSM